MASLSPITLLPNPSCFADPNASFYSMEQYCHFLLGLYLCHGLGNTFSDIFAGCRIQGGCFFSSNTFIISVNVGHAHLSGILALQWLLSSASYFVHLLLLFFLRILTSLLFSVVVQESRGLSTCQDVTCSVLS